MADEREWVLVAYVTEFTEAWLTLSSFLDSLKKDLGTAYHATVPR